MIQLHSLFLFIILIHVFFFTVDTKNRTSHDQCSETKQEEEGSSSACKYNE